MKLSKFIDSSPLFHIHLLSEKVFVPFQKKLKEGGLTFNQSLILSAMYFEEKSISPKNLSNLLQTTPSNISHSIKHLSNKGLIQRNVNNSDLRKVDLKLTNKGSKRVSKLIRIYNDLQWTFENELGERALALWNKKSLELIKVFVEQ